MAKGNMFQGMARGKVGDVVFSRLNGEQISRVRNRRPKNPRTNAQLYQRAIMATVMQAYSAGKVIFDHSFQDFAVGEANQRRFMSLNAKLLREQIANDINSGVEVAYQIGRVVAPGVQSPVPGSLIVSEGTLANPFTTSVPTPITDETVANYCARLGIVTEDLFTAVYIHVNKTAPVLFSVAGSSSPYAKIYGANFFYARYKVKEGALSSSATFETLADVLELSDTNAPQSELLPILSLEGSDDIIAPMSSTNVIAGAFIRSRINQNLRSKEQMNVYFGGDGTGIVSQYLIDAWRQGTESLGNSDLILEGGDE